MSEECKHGLEPQWCTTCKHGPRKPEKPTLQARFVAKYDGQCAPCNLPITPGQFLVKTSTDEVMHQGCFYGGW